MQDATPAPHARTVVMVFSLLGRAVTGTWNFVKRHPVAIGVTIGVGAGVVAGARRLVAQAENLQAELQAHIQQEMVRERR